MIFIINCISWLDDELYDHSILSCFILAHGLSNIVKRPQIRLKNNNAITKLQACGCILLFLLISSVFEINATTESAYKYC